MWMAIVIYLCAGLGACKTYTRLPDLGRLIFLIIFPWVPAVVWVAGLLRLLYQPVYDWLRS